MEKKQLRFVSSETVPGEDFEGEDMLAMKIGGLSKGEVESMKGMLLGQNWVRGNPEDGTLKVGPGYEQPPKPEADPLLKEFWPTSREKKAEEKKPEMQMVIPLPPKEANKQSKGIYISSLCGYDHTPENYRKEADKLERFGFECMRSRRGNDGKYWETWYLPGLWAAKEELRSIVSLAESANGANKEEVMEQVVHFLCKHCSFGNLDITVGRAAMAIE